MRAKKNERQDRVDQRQVLDDKRKNAPLEGYEGGYAGRNIYDNNSMRAGCIGIQQRKEYSPFGVSWCGNPMIDGGEIKLGGAEVSRRITIPPGSSRVRICSAEPRGIGL